MEEKEPKYVGEFRESFRGIYKMFDSIGGKFVSIDKTFKSIDRRFDLIDKRFDSIDKRFDAMDQRFVSIDKRFDVVDKEFEKINQTLEIHFEAIGELKVGITEVNILLRKKADKDDVRELDYRVKKLEKVVFV